MLACPCNHKVAGSGRRADGVAGIRRMAVAGMAVLGSRLLAGEKEAVLWRSLDLCAYHSAAATDDSTALAVLDINFNDDCMRRYADVPFLHRLLGTGAGSDQSLPPTPAPQPLAQHLRVVTLCIEGNQRDEGDALCSLVTAATHLRTLALRRCGLTSLQGLRGAPSSLLTASLKKVDVHYCQHLTALDGLESHPQLETLDASRTAITSLGPLRGCPALRKVDLFHCSQLASLEGLEHHAHLEEITASWTPITSVAALRMCCALKHVAVEGCRHLVSLDGLQPLAQLNTVNASETAIRSLAELQGCRALRTVAVRSCPHLDTLACLRDLPLLEAVDASNTPIPSVQQLEGCRALKKVALRGCQQLTTLDGLQGLQRLEEVDVAESAVTSLCALHTCPALRLVDVSDCQQLSQIDLPHPGVEIILEP